jgi:hydrogenase maturation protein HypF
VAWDGTGFGSDGHIWGGEFLIGDYRGFRRAAHLEDMPMPGGDAAVRDPYRLATGYLHALFADMPAVPTLDFVSAAERTIIRQQVTQSINCPLTSSGGRLFDAVSALIGVCARTSYEAQAAIELEMAASVIPHPHSQVPYSYALEQREGCYVIRLRELFDDILDDLRAGSSANMMAVRFHRTVADMIGVTCVHIGRDHGLSTVALSGGCFQNRLLLSLALAQLERAGFQVLLHRHVPCNDGGISLGQAVLAHYSTS